MYVWTALLCGDDHDHDHDHDRDSWGHGKHLVVHNRTTYHTQRLPGPDDNVDYGITP